MFYVAAVDFRHFGFVWRTGNMGRQGVIAVVENRICDWQTFELFYTFILNSIYAITSANQ